MAFGEPPISYTRVVRGPLSGITTLVTPPAGHSVYLHSVQLAIAVPSGAATSGVVTVGGAVGDAFLCDLHWNRDAAVSQTFNHSGVVDRALGVDDVLQSNGPAGFNHYVIVFYRVI